MKRILILSLTLFLCSCTSIPLGTMLEFRSFGKNDLIELDPEQIRAKLRVDEPVRMDTDEVKLSLQIETAEGVRLFNFPLTLLNENSIEAEDGWFSSSAAKTEYVLELSDEGVENFKATQMMLSSEESLGFNLQVNGGFEELPEDLEEVVLSIFLKLSDDRDYTTMLKNARLEISRED